MTSSKPPWTRTGAAHDPGLQALLALPPGERRDAVAKDIRRRAPQFSAIPAHDLADALDVPEHWLECIPPIDVDRSRQMFSIRDKHLASLFDRS